MSRIGSRPNFNTSVFAPFGEVRTAGPFTLAELTHKYYLNSQIWGTQIVGGGAITHNQDDASIRLDVGTAAGDKAVLQSHRYYRPIAGLGLRALQAASSANLDFTNRRLRVGLFDDDNGLFWEVENNLPYLVKRSDASGSPLDTKTLSIYGNVAENRVSFEKANFTNINSLSIDYVWEGIGEVIWLYNGRPIHTEQLQNKDPLPFLPHGSLPFRFEIENLDTTASANGLRIYASTALLYGGDSPLQAKSSLTTSATWSGTGEHVAFSVRPGATFKAHVFQGDILPKSLEVFSDSPIEFSIYADAALTGPSWAQPDADFALELDTTATARAGGDLLFSGFAPANVTEIRGLDALFDIATKTLTNLFPSGQNTLTVVLRRTQGSSTANADLSFFWGEVR